jgi:cation:H+ antiporter
MNTGAIIAIIAGLALLIVGAELLVRGATRLAAAFGVSPLVIGLTVVAFGTSSPEFAISITAGMAGEGDLVVGNVVGSNITNVLLILGAAAAISPLIVSARLIRIDVPLVIGAGVLIYILGRDGAYARGDGLLLFALIIAYIVFAIRQSRKESQNIQEEYAEVYQRGGRRTWAQIATQVALIISGLAALLLGSRWLLNGATATARGLGVSELVIGLTIVAFGTSAPELATSVLASVRGERDIAVGNVVGSSLFNLLAVLGLAALAAPIPIEVPQAAIRLDIPVMIAASVACLPIFFAGYRIARWEGFLFLGYYVAYTLYLLLTATEHAALPYFRGVMLLFIIPLTVITLAVSVARSIRADRSVHPI